MENTTDGRAPAFQAGRAGSIPVRRSTTAQGEVQA